MPSPKRVDANHHAIAQVLRQVGAVIINVSSVPGALDILCGFRGRWVLLEVKNPQGRGRRFTPLETETILLAESVGAPVYVVESVADALAALGIQEGG